MAYTKEEAIDKSIKIWEYLAKNGGNKKRAYIILSLSYDDSYCPCCHYATEQGIKQHKPPTCDDCPVWDNISPCTDNAYGKWNGCSTKENAALVLEEILRAKANLTKGE